MEITPREVWSERASRNLLARGWRFRAAEKFLPWKKAIERQLHQNEQVAKRRLEAAGYET